MQSRQRLVNNSGRAHRQAYVNASLIVGTVSPLCNICFNFSNKEITDCWGTNKYTPRQDLNVRLNNALFIFCFFGLVRNPVGWDNVTVVISLKPELFEVNCKLSATHYSNSTREGQKDKKNTKRRKKWQKSKWEQNKDTKCKVSITHYRSSTRAGQNFIPKIPSEMKVAPRYKLQIHKQL